jgi:hypothetical protein
VCSAAQTTADVPIVLKNGHAYNPQFVWPERNRTSMQSPETAVLANGLTGIVGTNYATDFAWLYPKVQHAQQNGELRAYVESFRWRKCATGACTDYAQVSVSSHETDPMDSTTLVSFLRTPSVYVDKPQFWVYFKVTDALGSPVFARTGANTVTLSGTSVGNFDQDLQSLTCTTGTALGQRLSGTWIYTCRGEAKAASFSSAAPRGGALRITATDSGGTSTTSTVGGNNVVPNTNLLTLQQTPDWWHADLRATRSSLSTPYSTSYASGNYPVTPAQPAVATSPTYPIYENEHFDVHVYNVATYTSNLVYGFTLHVKFDVAKVEYVSVTYGPLFPRGNTNDAQQASGQVTLIASSSEGSSGANANLHANGFFRYATVRFKRKAGATLEADGEHIDTGIRVNVAEVINDGNTNVVVSGSGLVMGASNNIYASLFDARTGSGPFGGTPTAGMFILAAEQSDRFLLYNYAPSASTQDHGRVFNRRAIDGSDNHDIDFQAVVVNDRMTYDQRHTAHSGQFYAAAASHTCAPATGSSSANYETLSPVPVTTCSLRTKIALGTDTANSRVEATVTGYTCEGQPSGTCSGTVDLRIVSPQTLTIALSNPTLKRIVPTALAGGCSETNIANSAYQTTSVTVYADGVDVTSWATGLLVDDPSLAEFLAAPSSSDNGRDRQHLIRGKTSGATFVKLHDQPGAVTAALTVDGASVAQVTEVIAQVITDVTWKSAAPGTIQVKKPSHTHAHTRFSGSPAPLPSAPRSIRPGRRQR